MYSNKTTKNIPVIISGSAIFVFILSQLIINSILNPLGTELQNLNGEKNYLVEENRAMEEQVAKTNSITVIKKLADKTLNLKAENKKTVIYINEPAVLAEK